VQYPEDALLIEPRGQAMQVEEPLTAYVPATHGEHVDELVAPSILDAEPTGHKVHKLLPSWE
jgi:hypothetical protein